ncbi:hypothetical protein SDC9_35895 [bioreactor metagenome]|uniref:Uncharacterized protein n=1 Tax=bioreactor metagenome TaxID=1076179 RepID=A0A644VGW0_9ZZZZ
MHVRARLALGRHAVDRTDGLAIDQNDALVALHHGGHVFLHDQRLAADAGKELVQRGEIAVVRIEPEHAGAAVAVKRLQDDIAMARLEVADRGKVARDQRRRRQIREVQHQKLLGRVAHPERVVDDQRRGVDPLEDMGGGDIAHVEGRILTQPDHVEARQIDLGLGAKGEVVPLLAPHGQRPAAGKHPALAVDQLVGRVIEQFMPPRLRLFGQPEGAVSVDVDRADRVHLDRNFQGHVAPFRCALDAPALAAMQSARSIGSVEVIGVLENLDPPLGIDQRHIEAPVEIGAIGGARDEFVGRDEDPAHLPHRQPLGRPGMGLRPLHLDEDHRVALSRDQVDLAAIVATPALRGDVPPRLPVVVGDLVLGRKAGMVGHRSAHLPFSSSSAA